MAEIAVSAESVVHAYDRFARFYDFLFGLVLQDGRKTLARVMETTPGQQLLEIGVGSGLMLPLYPRKVTVTGIDLSPQMLNLARSRMRRERLQNIELRLADAECTDLPDASFDHVVLPYVYSVTPDPLRLMRRAFRLCKPGGSIWVLNHFSQSYFWAFAERPLRSFAYSIGFRTDFPYKTYVTEQNWKIVAEYKVNLFSLSRLIHIRNGSRED
jgi:phosphatidylethanolamine/phosphatidyl-N-methylethanolamine N-methyltransferase